MEFDKSAVSLLIHTLNTSGDWINYPAIRQVLDSCGYTKKQWYVSDGSSKMAIVFCKQKVVVKWCFHEDCVDEAIQEVKIYQKAVEAGLAFFFPETEIFSVDGISKQVAIQEMVDYCARGIPFHLEKRLCKIGKTVTPSMYNKVHDDIISIGGCYTRHINREWTNAAISLYGKKKVKALCQFLRDNGINDLHDSNVGYKNKKPVILDFSGFYR